MGKLISYSGYDGVGKSTQIAILSEYLTKKKKNIYVTEEMFGYFLLKPIIKILRKKTGSPSSGPVKKNNNKLFKLWFLPAFIDIWLGYLISIRPKLKKYDYVIADRYYTDIWINLIYYGYAPYWSFFLISYLPEPDSYIGLSADTDEVLKREKEFNTKYYNDQKKLYDTYINKFILKNNFHEINANKIPKLVFKQIKSCLNI